MVDKQNYKSYRFFIRFEKKYVKYVELRTEFKLFYQQLRWTITTLLFLLKSVFKACLFCNDSDESTVIIKNPIFMRLNILVSIFKNIQTYISIPFEQRVILSRCRAHYLIYLVFWVNISSNFWKINHKQLLSRSSDRPTEVFIDFFEIRYKMKFCSDTHNYGLTVSPNSAFVYLFMFALFHIHDFRFWI